MSPFLFNLAVEPLNLPFHKAISPRLWEGIELCKNGTTISHLQYVDDKIMFFPPNSQFLLNIKFVLILFQLTSGLQVNFHKISIIGLNVTDYGCIKLQIPSYAEQDHCHSPILDFPLEAILLGLHDGSQFLIE